MRHWRAWILPIPVQGLLFLPGLDSAATLATKGEPETLVA